MKKLLFILLSAFIGCKKADVQWPSVNIGDRVWMVSNWDGVRYRNGDPIPEVKDSLQWVTLKTGAWRYYGSDSMGGRLYNWYAVNDPRGLAPTGWHVPNDDEWVDAIMYDGISIGGFNQMPGGYVGYSTHGRGSYGMWWSSTESDSLMASGYQVVIGATDPYQSWFSKLNGFSVRMIKD